MEENKLDKTIHDLEFMKKNHPFNPSYFCIGDALELLKEYKESKEIESKINQALGSKSIWHKINPAISGTAQGLKDHYYYLITHVDYKTPLKAKYHVEDFWDIIGTTDPNHPFVYGSERVWLSEENCPIIAWAELPDIYEENI